MIKKCPKCGALYDGRRWIVEPDKATVKKYLGKEEQSHVCPGCQRIEKKQVDGVVTLGGGFMSAHMEEVKNLVNRVAKNKGHRDAAARILDMREEGGKLIIETTDEHLAEQMGKEVEKAFKGELKIKWQEKDRFVRVNWNRD